MALSASGSIFIRQHALRMSKKNVENLVPFQKAFKRCHRRTKGQGPFVDKKSKNTLEIYTEKLKQNQSQSNGALMLPSVKASCIIYPEEWAEASGGPKSGCCYGFGSSYNESSSSSVPSSSINHSQVETANAKKIQELEKELEKQRVKMKKNIDQGIKNGTKDASSYVSRCVSGPTSFSRTYMCFSSWVLSTFSWPLSDSWSTSSFSVPAF